jgi:hypothetical protein
MTERIHRIFGAEHIQRFRLHSLSLSHPEVKLVRQPRPVRRERTVPDPTPHHPWARPRHVIFLAAVSSIAHVDVMPVVFDLFCNILESDRREGLPSLGKHSLPPPSKPSCETLRASVLPRNWPRPDLCDSLATSTAASHCATEKGT